MELQRPDAKRQVERHVGAEHVPPEAAKPAGIVALVEAGALLEHLRDGVERQQHRHQCHREHDGHQCHDDDAAARAV